MPAARWKVWCAGVVLKRVCSNAGARMSAWRRALETTEFNLICYQRRATPVLRAMSMPFEAPCNGADAAERGMPDARYVCSSSASLPTQCVALPSTHSRCAAWRPGAVSVMSMPPSPAGAKFSPAVAAPPPRCVVAGSSVRRNSRAVEYTRIL